MMNRAKMMVGAAALIATAGAAMAQPLIMEYDVDALGPGLYEYWFKVTVDDTLAPWSPGMGWNWLNFGSGQRSPTIPTIPAFQVTDPANFGEPPGGTPVGPWWQISSVSGGHNGPQFGPVTLPGGGGPNFWIPQAVGETLEWRGTTGVYVAEGNLTWATVTTTGGATTVSRRSATRNAAGPIGSCCLNDGSCIEVSSTGCSNVGGVYGGDNTNCAGANCQVPTGACCRDSGCVITNAVRCADTGGSYQGDNTDCATVGCTPPGPNTLTPDDFTAESRVWTYSPSYSKSISGAGFRATGFTLSAHADRALEGHQNDIVVEIVAPNGTTLLLGGDNTSPLVPDSLRYADIRTSGTSPLGNGNPANFNGTYSWDFGPADGDWTVNFWNNYMTTGGNPVNSEIYWNNISIELLDAGAGSCCLPDATCIDTAVAPCRLEMGHYRGDNTACGGCRVFLPIGFPLSSLTNIGGGLFMDLIATQDLTVDRLDYASTSPAGSPTTIEVWTFDGSYINNDADPTGWTLHETINTLSAGVDVTVPLELTTPLQLEGGETVGLYLVAQEGGIRFATGFGSIFNDGTLIAAGERTRTSPWGGSASTGRVLGGRVYYDVTPCTGDCPFMLAPQAPTFAVSADEGGQFFDITAETDVTITRIDYFAGVAYGNPVEAAVYMKQGSYNGFDLDPSAWTFVGNFSGLSGAATGVIPLELPTPVVIEANDTVAFYVVGTVGGYRYGPGANLNPVSDGNISLESNIARSTLFGGTLSSNRRFGGRIAYVTGTGDPPCYADCDGDEILTVDDFTCFINEFAAASALPPSQQVGHYANCDGSTSEPILTVDDFTCFINAFAAGCP